MDKFATNVPEAKETGLYPGRGSRQVGHLQDPEEMREYQEAGCPNRGTEGYSQGKGFKASSEYPHFAYFAQVITWNLRPIFSGKYLGKG